MGRMQDMEQAAARRALSLASRTEMDPLTDRLDRMGPALEEISASLGGLLGQLTEFMARVEAAEDGRAERLRETIAPAATAALDAAANTATAISRLSGLALVLQGQIEGMQDRMTVLQREMSEVRASTTAGALSQQLGRLTQMLAALPDVLAVRVEQAMEALPPGPSGTPPSGAPAPSAGATERLRLRAAAFEVLERWYADSPQPRAALERAMAEAREKLGPGPGRPT